MHKSFNNLGNSKAVIIPAAIRKNLGFDDYYELLERPDGVLIRPVRPIRSGWREAAAALQHDGMTAEERIWVSQGDQQDISDDWQW